MGCFLACFGSSKHNRNVLHRNASCKPQQQPSFPLVQDHSKILPNTSLQLQDKTVEELSVNARKKVTFDSNVKTYEPVLPEEVEKEEALVKPDHSKSSSEDSSVNSTGSYPPNHRYQNCRDSDDEDEEEELDDWPSDLSDDEDDGIREECDELGVEFEEDDMAYSKSRVKDDVVDHVFAEEVESPIIATCERDLKTIGFNPNARDRSVYVHPVLNPVENLSQWKIVKAKRTPRLRPQKENYASSDHELQVAFGVKEVSEPDMPKMLNQEIRVDASLSNWLGSSETTPIKKAGLYAVGGTPDRTTSQGSNSMISLEDRPILGALTVEEIKQFSATSSPRKSPCKSPDEMPIIGTVGSYWSSNEDSGSASSFKGIPNTTSKYREDKKVNWHATPFETRLEKALNRGAAGEAASTCVHHAF
ncbi:hypothetical protein P8452_02469 [Trifolium repens]|nr:hypothetical protein P8452_02469 [Trifolium repens]